LHILVPLSLGGPHSSRPQYQASVISAVRKTIQSLLAAGYHS